MSKLTKNERIDRLVACLRTQGIKMRELEVKLEALEEWSNGADDMLTELNHALPDPEYDAKCAENAVAVEESLERHAVRLGLVKAELTGSDLCRKMLERGDKVVLCAVSDDGDCVDGVYDAIHSVDEDGLFESHCSFWWYVQPVNSQGEPLTAADVGL